MKMLVPLFCLFCLSSDLALVNALSTTPDAAHSRRDFLIGTATVASTVAPSLASAEPVPTSVDDESIQAARAAYKAESEARKVAANQKMASLAEQVNRDGINAARSATVANKASVIPIRDPPALLAIRGGIDGKATLRIPRVGYSLYKTEVGEASRCTALALRAGVQYFDLGTQYGSNAEVAKTLKKYLNVGLSGVDLSAEKPELVQLLDNTRMVGEEHASKIISANVSFKSQVAPPPEGSSIGRRGRRERLFISHKVSNEEQSTDQVDVRRAVKREIATLGTTYLDLVSIHSPLTDKRRRLESYAALLDLRSSGFVKSVGVCNYGVAALKEIEDAELELPAINQIELSPFNTHADIIEYCQTRGIAVGCGAWSRLSSTEAIQDGWNKIADLAKIKGMTRAQVLVRWALQKGYVCVPRSECTYKIQRTAIAENTYGGVNPESGKFVFTDKELELLDSVNANLKSGVLQRKDGWKPEDIIGPDWDPTSAV